MKLEKKDQRSLKKLAWKYFSEHIRKNSPKCFTCDIIKPYKELQAGHWRHGHTKVGFFDERNVHSQCPKCNTYLSGNLGEYTLRMTKIYGNKTEQMWKEFSKDHNFTRKELILLIRKYKNV
ncbi:MAG: recombination protein NinG [Candidatus Paceibacterota bacterium]|jgi:hypothetical protein